MAWRPGGGHVQTFTVRTGQRQGFIVRLANPARFAAIEMEFIGLDYGQLISASSRIRFRFVGSSQAEIEHTIRPTPAGLGGQPLRQLFGALPK